MQDRSICSEAVRSALERNPFEKLSSIVFTILEAPSSAPSCGPARG